MGGKSKKLIIFVRNCLEGGGRSKENYIPPHPLRFSRITMINARKLCLSESVEKSLCGCGDVRRGEESADDGDAIGARIDNVAGVGEGNPADGN